MDKKGRDGSTELSSGSPTNSAGTMALKNFTISRKKRVSGQALLEPCPKESRDYSLIQSKLKDCRLDMGKEHVNAWLWKDIKLVHNEEFLREFYEKRSEMRTKGRRGRDMEERFCFLVASHAATSQVYQLGLRTERQDQYSLGKPSHGVYLYKHVDVALKHAACSTFSGKHLIIFKVLFGKVKKVTPSLDWNRTPDPMVAFDCHVSKDAISHRDSLSQQIVGSSVFLFDYNENQELNKRPRQCLPYAVVSFDSATSGTSPKSISPPFSPSKLPTGLMLGHPEHFRGCTVAERQGKGENATVTFKHFATQSLEYKHQPPGVDASPIQQKELQNPFPFIPQELHMPLSHTAESFSFSQQYFYSASLQSYLEGNDFSSNIEHPSPKPSPEKISTIVYSSRLVKDPRLSRQENNIQEKSSEQENGGNEQECSQNQEEQTTSIRTTYCEKQPVSINEEQREGVFHKSSLDDPHTPDPNPQPKLENLPSIKMFKMKFQKYAAYFKMTEKERHKNIMSQEKLTSEQKQLLIDRINFYELHYKKYTQKVGTEKSQVSPKIKSICLSTQDKTPLTIKENTYNMNESHVRQSEKSNVSNFTSMISLVDTERDEVDMFSKDTDKITNKSTESTVNTHRKKKQDCSSDCTKYYVHPQDGSMLQPEGEGGILEQSFEQAPLTMNTSEKNKATENKVVYEKTRYSKQDQANDQTVSEGETSTSPRESFPTETTLSSSMEEHHEFELHNITAMDGENSADISVLNVSENNDLSSDSVMRQVQQSQINPEKQDVDLKTQSKSDDSSEMSIVIKIPESSENTIHSALYERLKLDQLLPNLNGAKVVFNKSYLIPKDADKTSVISQQYYHFNEMPNEGYEIRNPQFIVMRKLKRLPHTTEKLTLSERFSKLRGFCKQPAVILHAKKFTNNYTTVPTRDMELELSALISSSDRQKGPIINNAELIQLMAQKYNERRSLAKSKCLRRKCLKGLRRKKSNSSVLLPLKHSAQSRAHVLRTVLHIRKRCVQKAKKRFITKLSLSRGSCCRALLSNSMVDSCNLLSCTTERTNTHKNDYDSCLNLGAISQLSDPPKHQSNDESSQSNDTANISSEDYSCLNTAASKNSQGHDDGFMHISVPKKQWVNSFTQHTENVCKDGSRILRNSNIKKSLGEITSDFKGPVMTYETEPEKGINDNNMCHQEQPHQITCSGPSESLNADGEGLKEEHKLSLVTQKIPREECDTKEISTYDNAEGRLAQTFLNNPAGITSSNKMNSYTEKALSPKTPVVPRIINDDKTDVEARFHSGNVVYTTSCVNGATTLLGDIIVNVTQTGEIEANVSTQNSGLLKDAKGTDVIDKELSRDVKTDADHSSLMSVKGAKDDAAKLLTGDIISSQVIMSHPSGPASDSQYHTAGKHTESSGEMNSQVETTADLNSEVITDAKEADVAVIKDNLHPAWRWQDKNSIPNMSENQFITKLRDYLTKFEVCVQRPESGNDSVKESKVPMAWITLDSTAHKRQLLDRRHYSTLDLTNVRHGRDNALDLLQSSTKIQENAQNANVLTETPNNSVTSTTEKANKGCSQPKICTSKRRKMSKEVKVSPQTSCVLEPVQKHSHSDLLVNKNTDPLQTSSNLPNTQHHWMHIDAKLNQAFSQGSGDLNGPSEQQGQVNQSDAKKLNKTTEHSLYDETVNNTYVQREFSVMDISNTLKLADHALSLAELGPLQLKCKSMLDHFISNFERDQQVSFNQSCVSRNLILEKYLDYPPEKVELKFEAVNSLLELQMMTEACQFVENKVNFLRRRPTFRSLLWYDPTLYGELYKGAVGFQQQSSLFSTFQQCLSIEGYGKLQEYYVAVSTLHQQLQDAPDTSYYMYLKSKRERLEIEAALRNPQDVKSFFLSVPIAIMINFGDNLESLEKAYRIVMTFVETPSDRLPGIFDVGKAEHLSILCRYLQEKVIFLKSCDHISKVSWFGLEHLLYDASKVILWRDSEHIVPHEVLPKYKRSNSQIVYGVTEAGIALVNKMDQQPQFTERFQLAPQQQMDEIHKYGNTWSGMSTNTTDRQIIRRNKQTRRSNKRRVTHPPLRSNDDGVTPHNHTNLATQLGNQTPHTACPQKSEAVYQRMDGKPAWDWTSPSVARTSHSEIRALLLSRRRTEASTELRPASVTNIQNHGVMQQQWPPPLIMNSAAAERMNCPPVRGTSHLPERPKEQLDEAAVPVVQPGSFPSFLQDASSVTPLALNVLPSTNTFNQVPQYSIPTLINYPYFAFNGQTYSTSGLDAKM